MIRVPPRSTRTAQLCPCTTLFRSLGVRLIRTLLDEPNTPLSTCGTCAGYLRQVWEGCGHPLRAGQSLWRPYETLNPAVRLQMLEAAATAISLIEVRDISPPGEHAKLFWRSEERRVGNECVSAVRCRGSPSHEKITQ